MGLVDDLNTSWALKHYEYLFTVEEAHVLVAEGDERLKWMQDDPNILAFTHGNSIVFRDRSCINIQNLRHELCHIHQSRSMGGDLIFKPAVLLSGVWAAITRGNPYDNFFERRAHAAEED